MSFYKLESKYPYISAYGSKRTKIYKFFYKNVDSLIMQVKYEMSMGGRISCREICEAEYIKGVGRN